MSVAIVARTDVARTDLAQLAEGTIRRHKKLQLAEYTYRDAEARQRGGFTLARTNGVRITGLGKTNPKRTHLGETKPKGAVA